MYACPLENTLPGGNLQGINNSYPSKNRNTSNTLSAHLQCTNGSRISSSLQQSCKHTAFICSIIPRHSTISDLQTKVSDNAIISSTFTLIYRFFLLFCGLTQTKVSRMSTNVFLIVWHEINPYRFGMTRGILSANHVKVYRSLIGSRHMSVWRCVSNCFSNSMKHLYNRAALHWEYMLLLEDQYVQ